jgi:hypothetical protein
MYNFTCSSNRWWIMTTTGKKVIYQYVAEITGLEIIMESYAKFLIDRNM